MRMLHRGRCRAPRGRTIRPAEPYLLRGVHEARRRGHNYVGTEHVLLALARDTEGGTARLLRRLGTGPEAVEDALACWLGGPSPGASIDPEALATLGIDFEVVRERLEQTFGRGALEETRSGCLGIVPRLKLALALAVDHAGDAPVADEHVLLGLLGVPDSVAARVLAGVGISLAAVKEVVESDA